MRATSNRSMRCSLHRPTLGYPTYPRRLTEKPAARPLVCELWRPPTNHARAFEHNLLEHLVLVFSFCQRAAVRELAASSLGDTHGPY